jgi:hypothetical protein
VWTKEANRNFFIKHSSTIKIKPLMRKISLTLLAGFLFSTACLAQTADQYIFAASTGATLDPMTGATVIVPANTDNTPSALQTIPFTFVYEGRNYTQFSVSPDGFMKLGSTPATASPSNNVYSGTIQLFPFWDDLATGTNGSVSYVVTGTAPNRILKVQWLVTVPKAAAGTANSTMQAWLYEGTNVIEFRYGAGGGPAASASIGINGNINYNFISVTTPANTASNQQTNDNNTAWPGNGTMYKFTPPAVSACTRPTTQATNLSLPDRYNSYIGGYFTAAANNPSGYLIVRSIGALNTNPVDGTDYVQNSTLGNGTVVQSGSTLSFTASGLQSNTTYTFTVFSYNSGTCSGGPLYNTTSTLTGSASTTGALPITISSFNVSHNGLTDNLNWSTAQESNTNAFVVERSADNMNYIQIGKVAAAGNSNVVRSYQFTDAHPLSGLNYYRLMAVDKDANMKLSDVRSIKNIVNTGFTVYPNPAAHTITLDLNTDKNDEGAITITDLNGRKLYGELIKVVPGTNYFSIDVTTLKKGTYIIKADLPGNNVISKFTKN